MILYIIIVDLDEESGKSEIHIEEGVRKMAEQKSILSKALDIAKHILAVCSRLEDPIPITNIKLQKLLYLVYGNFLLDNSEEKLFGERFEAWQYGPAVAEVYDTFCEFSGSQIFLIDTPPELPEDITKAIDPTIEANMHREVFDLVAETHKPGSAWAKAMERKQANSTSPVFLRDEDIIEEFRKRRDGDEGTPDL